MTPSSWRHKESMPDPIVRPRHLVITRNALQAALERVNQMERDNPMPFKKMKET
jgi:hypothetical protein